MLSAHQKVFSRRIPGLGQCCDQHRTAQGSCRSPAAPQVICKKKMQYFQGNTVILSTRNRKNSLKALTFSTSSVYYSTGLTSKRNQTAWAPQSSPRYPNSHPTIVWFYSLQHRGVAYQPTHICRGGQQPAARPGEKPTNQLAAWSSAGTDEALSASQASQTCVASEGTRCCRVSQCCLPQQKPQSQRAAQKAVGPRAHRLLPQENTSCPAISSLIYLLFPVYSLILVFQYFTSHVWPVTYAEWATIYLIFPSSVI